MRLPPCEPQVEDQPGKLFPDCSERPVAGSWIPQLGSSNCQTGNPVQTEPYPGIRLLHPLRGVHLISRSVLRDPFPVENVVQQMRSSPDGVVCAFSIPRYSGGSKWYL
ncbi:hypothetical protein ABHI18_003402 [Aspergillus niger]